MGIMAELQRLIKETANTRTEIKAKCGTLYRTVRYFDMTLKEVEIKFRSSQ